MSDLTTAIPQLSQVPQCILPAYGAIAAAGCGPDLACICGNDNFFFTLQGVLVEGACTPVDAQEATLSTQTICAKAVPWLNQDRGPEFVAATTIMTVLATFAFILRVIARRMSKLRFGVDDWLVALALLFAYGLTITEYLGIHYGIGRHILMLQTEQLISVTKTYFAGTIIFAVSAAAVKLSVLFFYHRIFPGRPFRIISIVIGLVVIAWFIAFIFLIFFTCIPLAYWWDKTIPGGHCINATDTAYYGTSPPDILTNIAILILPIPYLWKLQMQRWKKLAITFIFLLGSFATVGSIVRVPLLAQLKATDISYTIVNSGIWLNVECNIGVLSASLPMLRPLLSKTLPSTLRSRFSRSRNGAGSHRLPDVEKQSNSNTGRSSTLVGSNGVSSGGGGRGSKVYLGGSVGKSHKSWYDTAVSAMASKSDHRDGGSEGSQEEMVPMGKIAVRHELDWESKERAGAITPHAV